MSKLSPNFSLSELTKSQTAERKGIQNNPNADEIYNLTLLCENILQPIRNKFGSFIVSSGYRCPELSIAIGSSENSQHCKGQAADFEVAGVDNYELALWIKDNLNFDQLILEFYDGVDPNSGWVHCSCSMERSRKQMLKAEKIEGRTSYSPILL